MREESRQEGWGEEQQEEEEKEKAQAETEEASRNRLNQQTMQEHTEIPTMGAPSGNQRGTM